MATQSWRRHRRPKAFRSLGADEDIVRVLVKASDSVQAGLGLLVVDALNAWCREARRNER